MTSTQIAVLGAIAGFTIYLGLPIGRIPSPSRGLREFLNAGAIGVLVFLLAEVSTEAAGRVVGSLKGAIEGEQDWVIFAGRLPAAVLGLGVGLVGLAYYERWVGARAARRHGPGAMAVAEPPSTAVLADPARRVALMIAIGIGLHNLAEGLAIGQSAAAGKLSLAVLLVIGFALHNATEGFGITAPLVGQRPSWGFLGVLGLIGGGPTLVGTLIGQAVVNGAFYVASLSLAAGSILYVIVQLIAVGVKLGKTPLLYWGLLVGMLLGFGTEFVIGIAKITS